MAHKNIFMQHDGKVKRQKSADQHSPRPLTDIYHLPNPPAYLLTISFKLYKNELLKWTFNVMDCFDQGLGRKNQEKI
jgi:hypothetical protein